jgi:cytochrome c peroxidase
MKAVIGILCICFSLAVMQGLREPPHHNSGVEPAVVFFKAQAKLFAASAVQLQTAIAGIKADDTGTLINARQALQVCRLQYKKIAFFLEYFFKSSAFIYNSPPKYEIEEPYMEYQEPIGLQVIEGLLFEKDVMGKKQELLQQADAVSSSAGDLSALLYGFQADDKRLLESVRLELIRIITLDIEGFDAPLLKSGIAEAAASLEALQHILQPFLAGSTGQADSVATYLTGGLRFLQQYPDFDRFNRLAFLTQFALPLQRHLGLLIKALKLELNTTGGVLNYEASNIFSTDALDLRSFPGAGAYPDTALVQLGRKLFFEPGLSGNNTISCATCHDPAKHFTDALPQSVAFDGHSHVQRNAATLLYAGFQYGQFWDGRAKSLEEQVKVVISNPQEMNGGAATVLAMLKQRPEYVPLFARAFASKKDSATLLDNVAYSLAAFVRSLNPRNSRFDQYIQGKAVALTAQEINGFNLFMGKAQCGTCHFAPLFNGLVPPLYNLSELEVLGTTKTDNLDKPEPDSDSGRFKVFPIAFYEKAFKTPTVRNASATGPYMHNGSFKTLETVVEFYNKGGANGLGLTMNNQTLSPLPLNLSKDEVNDIVSFMQALEDEVPLAAQQISKRNYNNQSNKN